MSAEQPLRLFLLPAQLERYGGLHGVRHKLGYGFEIWEQSLRVGEASRRLAAISEPEAPK